MVIYTKALCVSTPEREPFQRHGLPMRMRCCTHSWFLIFFPPCITLQSGKSAKIWKALLITFKTGPRDKLQWLGREWLIYQSLNTTAWFQWPSLRRMKQASHCLLSLSRSTFGCNTQNINLRQATMEFRTCCDKGANWITSTPSGPVSIRCFLIQPVLGSNNHCQVHFEMFLRRPTTFQLNN